MAPKVSVLIPAYNHERYLKDTINSVLNQSFSDFELLILDDCSTDNTAEVIKTFSDKRITCIFPEKNCGTVRSLNHLLELSKGEYIAVLGSDDVWHTDKLQQQVEFLDNNPSIAACFTKAKIIDDNSAEITSDSGFPINIFEFDNRDKSLWLSELFVSGNHFCHSSALIRADVHREIGLYNPAYRQLHDLDLWVRILLKHDIHIIDSKLVNYRFVKSSDNLSKADQKNSMRLFNEAVNIMEFLFSNISDCDFIKGFSHLLTKKNASSPEQIVCEKFLILQNHSLWGSKCTTLPISFILDNLTDNVVECFENDYDITLKDIYDYTCEYSATTEANAYNDNIRLQGELNLIHNSKYWRFSRFIKKLLRMN